MERAVVDTCAEKSADVMLTTDDSLIKKVKENRDKIKVRGYESG